MKRLYDRFCIERRRSDELERDRSLYGEGGSAPSSDGRWILAFRFAAPMEPNKKAILARPVDLDAWIAMRCSVSRRSLEKQSALSVRTSLSAELETARLLRESQRELRAELHAEIAALKARVVSIWQQECRMQNGLVEALWQGVDPALQPASSRAADEVVIPFQQPVRDEMGPILRATAFCGKCPEARMRPPSGSPTQWGHSSPRRVQIRTGPIMAEKPGWIAGITARSVDSKHGGPGGI